MKRRNKNPEKVQKSIGSTILVFYYIDLIGSKLLHFTAYMPGNPEKTGHLAKDQTSRKDQTSGKDRISGKRPDVRQKTGYRYSAKKTRYLAKSLVPVSGKRRGTRQKNRYSAKDRISGKRPDIRQRTGYPVPLPCQQTFKKSGSTCGKRLERLLNISLLASAESSSSSSSSSSDWWGLSGNAYNKQTSVDCDLSPPYPPLSALQGGGEKRKWNGNPVPHPGSQHLSSSKYSANAVQCSSTSKSMYIQRGNGRGATLLPCQIEPR